MVKAAVNPPSSQPARFSNQPREAAPDVSAPPISGLSDWAPPLLAVGHAGPDVAVLQQYLVTAGYTPGAIDGKFGPLTLEAVKTFQRVARLNDDGQVGPKTIEALRSTLQVNDLATRAPQGLVPPLIAAQRPVKELRTGPAPTPASALAEVAAPLRAVAPLVTPKGINPLEALKLVKSGEVDISIPMSPGPIAPGTLTAHKNTTVRLQLSVKDGNIDFAKSKVTFSSTMHGPFGTSIRGFTMTEDGHIEVDLKNLPDLVKIGNPASAKLVDFVEQMRTAPSLPVSILGWAVKKIDMTGGPGVDVKAIAAHSDLAASTISVSNVTFINDEVSFGNAGSAKLGASSKLTISGTLTDMRIKGFAKLDALSLNAGGTMIKGANGSADLDVRVRADATLQGHVDTSLTNLQLQADYAVSRRQNGDYLELARGNVQNGSVAVSESIGVPGAKSTTHLQIGDFEGTIISGRITIPDRDGYARVNLGKTFLKGAIEVTGKHVLVSGDVDLVAQVDQYDSPGQSASLRLTNANLSGKARAKFDSEIGVHVEGEMRLISAVETGRVTTKALKGEVLQGTVDANVTTFEMANDGKLDIRGSSTVNFGFQNVALKTASGIALSGGRGRLTGTGDLRISDAGLELSNGKLKISAAVEDGRITMGKNVFDVKKGSTIEAVLARAFFGDEAEFDMSSMKVDATLDGGNLSMKGQEALKLNDGAKLKFVVDRLQVSKEGGYPKASGSLELTANLGTNQIDRASAGKLLGVDFSLLDVGLDFKLKVGRFSIDHDGTFDVQGLGAQLEANARHFGGRLN